MQALLFSLLVLIMLGSCTSRPTGSLSPSDGVKSLKLAGGFRAELFAAEPDVVDPVEMAFDEFGRAYVAEMMDLPDDPPAGKKARGRIRMLEDTNGDGRADKSTVFAVETMHASGLMPWKGGVIVPASPEILYLKDTNGDGKADVREVWFTGFAHGNPEAQITNPRLGPDNWIYFSNTGNPGEIRSPKHPDHPPVQVRGFDFRYDPIRGVFEPASGVAQYGLTMDDFGARFISQNTIHIRHVVIPRRYIARAPLLQVPTVLHDPYGDFERKMYPRTQPQEWRVLRTKMRQEHYTELGTGRTEHVGGYITGAAGSTIYNGDAWPREYYGNIFTGDVSGNLVRRDVLTPDGVTFRARPGEDGSEFLASTDQWFRPTNFANGPDGHLYVTDMQREVIETPLSVPEELRKTIDFYKGDTLGRIYRIVPEKPVVTRPLKEELGKEPTDRLVAYLEHPNGWHRDTAQRLLLERQDRAAVRPLGAMAASGKAAAARLRALYLLRSLRALTEDQIRTALGDAEPRVRVHAIALAETFPGLEPELVAMAPGQDARVRFQLAFTLGAFQSKEAKKALVEIAAADPVDPYLRTALLSSVPEWPVQFLAQVAARDPKAVTKELVASVGSVAGARKDPAEMQLFVGTLAKAGFAEEGLTGLARGLEFSGARGVKAPAMETALAKYLAAGSTGAWDVARYFELKRLTDKAAADAVNAKLADGVRARAVTALRGAPAAKAIAVVDQVLGTNPAPALQSAAMLTLASLEGVEATPVILKHWKALSPEARPKAIGALMARQERIPALLDALEQKQVEVSALEINARNRLLESSDAAIAARVRKILQTAGTDRAAVITAHKDVLLIKGDKHNGKEVFEQACSRCHLPRKQGGRIGPDLSGISVKSKEELLQAILNPSAAIEPRYVNYLVTTKDGRMYDGVIAAETPGAVTLRGGAEEDVTIPRTAIAEIRASSMSLMPEDIEQSLSKQNLADVITYLRGGM